MSDIDIFGEGIDPEEMEETSTQTFEIEGKPKKQKDDILDAPIENVSEAPLFIGFDKRRLRTIAYLKVIKLDKPGNGYKGQIPVSSTLETIYQLHGDGLYNIEACNPKHEVLHRLENVNISLGGEGHSTQKQVGAAGKPSPDAKDFHINKLITELASSRQRDKELSDKSIAQITEQGKSYTELVRTTTESAAERERAHMNGVNKNQQDFFQGMLLQTNQMFQQTMALMIASHQQTMEILRASNERDVNNNNPMTMVQVLLQGLKMGRELEGDDSPDWLKGVSVAKDALGSLATLAVTATAKKQLPVTANPSTPQTQKQEKPKKSPKRVLSDEELLEVVRFKRVLHEQGIELVDLVRQSKSYYENISKDESSENDEDVARDNEETNQSGSADVVREDNNDSDAAKV